MAAVKMAVLLMLCLHLSAGFIHRATAINQLTQGGIFLASGQALEAGNYRLAMQTDCNLVLYHKGDPHALWSSQTDGDGIDCFFGVLDDGNAVVFTRINGDASQVYAVWSTETCCRNDGEHVFVLQDDGNLVVYNSYGQADWASGTNGQT